MIWTNSALCPFSFQFSPTHFLSFFPIFLCSLIFSSVLFDKFAWLLNGSMVYDILWMGFRYSNDFAFNKINMDFFYGFITYRTLFDQLDFRQFANKMFNLFSLFTLVLFKRWTHYVIQFHSKFYLSLLNFVYYYSAHIFTSFHIIIRKFSTKDCCIESEAKLHIPFFLHE